jgi:hypothetical protein
VTGETHQVADVGLSLAGGIALAENNLAGSFSFRSH